jgi:hypothetical protein
MRSANASEANNETTREGAPPLGTILDIKNSFKECQIKFDNRGDYVFDISKNEKFRGYEKWEISSYVATKDVLNEKEKRLVKSDVILTFEELAKLSVIDGINENYKRERGVEAIGIFKGDVDFMGNLYNSRIYVW